MNGHACQKRTIDDVTSSCFSSIRMESSSAPAPGRSKRRRQRDPLRSVHFAEDYSTSSGTKKPLHTTYHVENWMNLVDKEDLWVHPHDTLRNVLSIRARGTLYQQQQPTATSFRAYSEALKSSFLLCCCDSQDDNELTCRLDDKDEVPSQKPEINQDVWNTHQETFNWKNGNKNRADN